MHQPYRTLVLSDENWERYKTSLSSYPLRMSKISKLESKIQVSTVSIKYVSNGKETYTLGGNHHQLGNNQFIVANKYSECKVSINEQGLSTGICIDLDPRYLSEMISAIQSPENIDDPGRQNRFFFSDELYSQKQDATGKMKAMLTLLAERSERGMDLFAKEDFLKEISLELVLSQQPLVKEYYRLDVLRSSTRRELYTRLLKSREIMSDAPGIPMSVKEIAAMVCLSEFRFHHLFKQVFGITPHQFQVDVLMQQAVSWHKQTGMSWSEIAVKSGYSDIHAFSKVFKKKFGVSPRNFSFA